MKTKKIKNFGFSLIIATLFALTACGGNGNNSNKTITETPKQLQYSVKVDDDFFFQMHPNTSEAGACFKVFECTESGDKIYENEFQLVAGNSKTFTAQPNVKKVKVYVMFCTPLGHIGEMSEGWLPLVYYLSPDEIKEIKIDTYVEMSRREP